MELVILNELNEVLILLDSLDKFVHRMVNGSSPIWGTFSAIEVQQIKRFAIGKIPRVEHNKNLKHF